jgi:hypothetical protein
MSNDTETISKLFLELSQFTDAKTARELHLESKLKDLGYHVAKLVRHIKKTEPENEQAQRALDYMARMNIGGNLLR